MASVLDRPENAGALRYLAHGRDASDATFGPPPPDVDRLHLGTHPDIVDRLWDTLNAALPETSRWLVYDGPALVHSASGILLAAGIGTQYALRLLAADVATAAAEGFERAHAFRTVGTQLDLQSTFGPEWIFGRFDDREPGWLRASYEASSG